MELTSVAIPATARRRKAASRPPAFRWDDFEPSWVAERIYISRRRRLYVDVSVLLSVMLGLLYLMPARLIVPNLTYAGRPALLMAMLLWCWWLIARLNPRLVMVGPQPMRWVTLIFVVAMFLSYEAGVMRGLPTLEANGQDFTVLSTFEFLGVLLVAADGLPNWARLRQLLKVFVWCATFMALSGLLQSVAKFDITHYYESIPGLVVKGYIIGFEDRGVGLYRVAGTATHYIEFGTVMAVALPFAIHFARFSSTRGMRRAYAVMAVLIGAAIPVAISRTGIVALAVVIVVMVPVWPPRFRYNMLVLGVGLTGALAVVKPGLIGTIRYLFFGASSDPSVTARTDRYPYIEHWFSERPWLGRGPGTLIPQIYNIVTDNQWLYTLVTGGLVGVVALAVLHLVPIRLGWLAVRRAKGEEERHLCAAILATPILGVVAAGTFDAFDFTTYSTTLALMLGLCGAVWRFTHPARTVRTSTVRMLPAEIE